MCGFVGQLGANPDLEAVERSAGLLRHRGPDDAGSFAEGPVAFGFRRLSILDLSPAGHQPMASSDGRLHVMHNGEIYNYLELRTELERLGARFRTGTDTEVILAAYQRWGTGCFTRFNGMWAIAIWDAGRGELILSRDRFGEKPLYYCERAGGVLFGSEIKALLPFLPRTPAPNERLVFDYLAYGFHDHTAESFFSGIRQIEPGAFAVATVQGIRHERYWTLNPSARVPANFDEAAATFRELLTDSIRLRLRSDVPIGTCLSGGLDSSAIALLAYRELAGGATHLQQKTFTAGSLFPRYDERRYARLVNAEIRGEANEVIPDPKAFRAAFDSLLWHQEEPFLSLSIYAQWEVTRRARERGVTVLLDGQGGDEVLAGYLPYFGSRLAALLRSARLTEFLREGRGFLRNHRASLSDVLPTFALYLLPGWMARIAITASDRPELAALDPSFRRQYRRLPDLPRPFADPFKNHLWRLLTGTGVRALLHYEDRNAMAHSIEARVPFLDHRLAEFTLGLPDTFLLAGGQTKRLLRQALANVLPPEIRDRRDKMGFVVPQNEWFRGALAADLRQTLTAPNLRIAGYVQKPAIARYLRDFLTHRVASSVPLWRWYNLERWLVRFHG